MQQNDRAEKLKIYFDGEEIPGLVAVGDRPLEESTVDVPSFGRIKPIKSGITKYPPIELTYKLNTGTNTEKFFNDFKSNNEIKDMSMVKTDAHGVEYARKLYSGCECSKVTEPAYDAASPTFAKILVTILADDIKNI